MAFNLWQARVRTDSAHWAPHYPKLAPALSVYVCGRAVVGSIEVVFASDADHYVLSQAKLLRMHGCSQVQTPLALHLLR